MTRHLVTLPMLHRILLLSATRHSFPHCKPFGYPSLVHFVEMNLVLLLLDAFDDEMFGCVHNGCLSARYGLALDTFTFATHTLNEAFGYFVVIEFRSARRIA